MNLLQLSKLLDSPNNRLLYLISYGSKEEGRDIDIFAVYEYPVENYRYTLGMLDIFAVGKEIFDFFLRMHDIIVTEPLHTGKVILGDISEWNDIKRIYLNTPPDLEAIYYLKSKSFQVAEQADVFLKRYESGVAYQDFVSFWVNLSFAIAYMQFAFVYKRGAFPVTLEEVKKECPFLLKVLKILRNIKHLKENTDCVQIDEIFKQYKEWAINI